MDKLSFKKEVLENARKRQWEIIHDFKARIDDITDSEANLNEDQFDHDQRSKDEAGMALINALADELNFATEEMDLLERMEVGDHVHDQVSIGSIVKTDQRMFFPSVSIEEFSALGQVLFGISAKAPLFEKMKGKKAGETFNYNGQEYKVVEVY